MRTFLKLLPFVVLAGCSTSQTGGGGAGGASGVDLTVNTTLYQPGDAILLTLTNRSSSRVGYNLCNTALDRRVGGDWAEAPQRLVDVCTMELRTLVPNEATTYRHALPSNLPWGEYRLRTRVEAPLGRLIVNVSSPSFSVGG